MKSKILWILLLVVAISLAGCNSQAPAATSAPSATSEAYPQPGQAAAPAAQSAAYPAPGVEPAAQVAAADTTSMYPDPKSGDEIGWLQALALLDNDEVTQIVQEAEMKVTLMLRDGRSLWTVQPVENEILNAIQKCGEVCADIKTGS